MLPFTHQQFLDVFAAYNAAVWPVQVLAYLAAAAVCWAIAWSVPADGRLAAWLLGLGWAWTGVAYHLLQFARINPAAYAFGALFVLQGALFVFLGWRRPPVFAGVRGPRVVLGWMLIAYSTLAYPLAGLASGMAYPALPMFGITPCPLTLFTYGVMLLAAGPWPWWLLVLPAAWSLVGGSAAILLGVPQDWPLLLSVGLVPWLVRRRGPAGIRPA